MADKVNQFVSLWSYSWKLGSSSARNRSNWWKFDSESLWLQTIKAIFEAQGSEYYLELSLKIKSFFAGFLIDFQVD